MKGHPSHTHTLLLSCMMFLQYAVWGIWVPVLANYLGAAPADGGLGFNGGQVGFILGSATAVGALTAPFVAGQLADRFMNAERALAMLLVLGGATNIALSRTTQYPAFLGLSVFYSIFFLPTISLSNSVAFANIKEQERIWPIVRSAGTIGWIVASVLFGQLWLNTPDPVLNTARVRDSLLVSGLLSMLYALYSFSCLPKTPPKKSSGSPLAFLKAFKMLKSPGFALVLVAALPIALIHAAFWLRYPGFLKETVLGGLPANTRQSWVPWISGLGQASEIGMLCLLGLLIRRMGYKSVMLLGALGYILRAAIFARAQPLWLAISAQLLHGVCFACFIASVAMYAEKVAPKDVRHSVQTMVWIVFLGIGPILCGPYNKWFDHFQDPSGAQSYQEFWWATAAFACLSFLILWIFFAASYEPERESVPEIPLAEEF